MGSGSNEGGLYWWGVGPMRVVYIGGKQNNIRTAISLGYTFMNS